MEFRFNLNTLFRSNIVKITNSLLPDNYVAACRRSALDATAQIAEVINFVGQLSAQAQGLSNPVTTSQKLRNSDHHIYILYEPNERNGLVVGLLKVGRKSLYVFDHHGETQNVTALCVLDFYVHESRQRLGLGRMLFDHMLQEEELRPEEMAIDRPSEKLLGFLHKHYGLTKKIPQMNNFVIYEGFFSGKLNSDIDGRRMHITASPNTNLFGPSFTTHEDKRRSNSRNRNNVISPTMVQQGPVGRYAAKRPSCSMAQIIHNSPTAVSTDPNSTSPVIYHDEGIHQQFANHQHHHHHHDTSYNDSHSNHYHFEDEHQHMMTNFQNMDLRGTPDSFVDSSGHLHHHHHHHQSHEDHHHFEHVRPEVKFADEYEPQPEQIVQNPQSKQPESVVPQSPPQHPEPKSQSQTENILSEHPIQMNYDNNSEDPKTRFQHTKQHTGLKNVSFGVGAAVTPSGKMEFHQETNDGFGSVKINRPLGAGLSSKHDSNDEFDGNSMHSKESFKDHLTNHGHFDLKFYHNKLW